MDGRDKTEQFYDTLLSVYVRLLKSGQRTMTIDGYTLMMEPPEGNVKTLKVTRVSNGVYSIGSGLSGASGTAFCVKKDGTMLTNLHIAKPWVYEDDSQAMLKKVAQVLEREVWNNLSAEVKINGVMEYIGVIPDGKPLNIANFTEARVLKAGDDPNVDVASIKTVTNKLPEGVDEKSIIDIEKADMRTLKVGEKVYTIGYPHGAELGLNSETEVVNQVHAGTVTQDKGEYEFMHDAATTSGASGSPLLNAKGHLIGVHHAGLSSRGQQGFNMGIKVKWAIPLAK